MATLSIRNLPDGLHQALREQAAKHGRSMEAEAREILARAVDRPRPRKKLEDLQRLTREMFGDEKPENVVDEFLRERRQMWGDR